MCVYHNKVTKESYLMFSNAMIGKLHLTFELQTYKIEKGQQGLEMRPGRAA